MCTACYSKMQREKKKGSTDGIYSERITGDDVVIESHHFNVRGSRHASAAARKFIEEFARNKGGWEKEKGDGSQKRETVLEQELLTRHNSSRPTEEAADTVLTTTSMSVPKGTSEELFHLAQSCCAAGNKILRRDGRFTSQQGMIYVTERSRSLQGVVEQGTLAVGESRHFRVASANPVGTHSYRHESEQPDVLQGAADLLHMMKEQSMRPGKVYLPALWFRRLERLLRLDNWNLFLQIVSARGHNRGLNHHDPTSLNTCLGSMRYPWSTRRSTLGCGNSFPVSGRPGDTCMRSFPFASQATARHMVPCVHGHSANNQTLSQQFLDVQSETYHCNSSDVA